MNQRQNQPPQPPAPGQPGAGAPMMAPQAVAQGVSAHLMGLMTNPALAAAAAASPFPAAMLSNPGAFLAMPEAFVNGRAAAQAAVAAQAAAPGGVVLPRLDPNNPMQQQQQQQQQHRQGLSPVPGTAGAVMAVGNMGMAALQPQNGQAQQHQAQYVAQQHQQQQQHVQIIPPANPSKLAMIDDKKAARRTDLTPEERAKQNRDRNREHARSTRLRKKAYVQKLKELVEGLHAERTEEVRQRRVAIQHLAEMQNVRRGVVRTFLRFHSNYETDPRKWETLLEDNFWLKQPVTPYRSFRRTEIEQDCRISRGVQGMIADSASVAVMVEGIGSRSTRWMQIKREEFFFLEESKRGPSRMPRSIQDNRLNAAVSSLSSSSGSSSGSASEEAHKSRKQGQEKNGAAALPAGGAKVSSSSGSSSESRRKQLAAASKDFHDYHAQPLPDPKLGDSGSSSPSEDSPEDSNSTNGEGKRVCTDSSSGDDSGAAIAAPRAMKRRKTDDGNEAQQQAPNASAPAPNNGTFSPNLPPNIAKTGGITANVMGIGATGAAAAPAGGARQDAAPPSGRISAATAVALPPFAGIGKRAAAPEQAAGGARQGAVSNVPSGNASSIGGAAMVTNDTETSSSNSQIPQIRAFYHINEDDMILMEDVLMCPFIFRSQDAVVCGALAECVMPGMFRAHFSARNKLLSVEMVYDAMGFMQQLERASGSERTAQIIPGSLEMALSPTSTEARVITLAEPPFLIVNVNEVWTRLTKYTQMEVEGRELLALLEGEKTLPEASDRPGKPRHKFEDVAKALCASSTNIHYDKDGREFVDFVCSYPLTNANDEVTHLLHTSRELPALPDSLSADQ
ncbi:expressed unknown protein [Seminavis robusta]|uniref:BZIP domain-containing protein n=1 Tax=Seminavis robusta TaxID=568900 RepID=A0A9N8EPS2_9STRA|nr:expressed unknown protein [Seminavis robusta]|eukprot:Sro1509_g278510.1 n/a (847) ;mRNA; f:5093-7812